MSAQSDLNTNMATLFNLPTTEPTIDPVQQGKAWSELSDKKLDDTDDLLVNKLTVELILTNFTQSESIENG